MHELMPVLQSERYGALPPVITKGGIHAQMNVN